MPFDTQIYERVRQISTLNIVENNTQILHYTAGSTMELQFNSRGWPTADTDKHVICLPTLQRNSTPSVEITPTEGFNFSAALEAHNYLLAYIFAFLETKDLKTLGSVNSRWSQFARREFQRRADLAWAEFYYRPVPVYSTHLRASLSWRYGYSSMGVVLYCPIMINLEHRVWLDKIHGTLASNMTSVAEYIDKQVVPSDVDHCIIPCSRIFSSSTRMRDTIYYGLFIPFIPNIRTAMFYCDTRCKNLSVPATRNETFKCILMFSRSQLDTINHFFDAILKRQSPDTVAVGGGLVHSLSTFTKVNNSDRPPRNNNLFCIAFLQEEGTEANFNAYSLVFNSYSYKFNRYGELENELVKLKASAILRKQGIVFKFSYFVPHARKAIAIIEEHFPKYTVVGLELKENQTIGWNCFNKPKHEESDKSKPDFSTSLHSQTLSLVLITWGAQI